jgi:Cytochrome C oxidase, cbb3-type, subunit III
VTRMLIVVCVLAGAAVSACGRNPRMDALYAERCMSCHGRSGRGDGALAQNLPTRIPDFRDTVERKSVSQIRRSIAQGRGMMPAFAPALRPAEISDLVAMVRFLSREGRDVKWWERFDALVVAHCNIPWDAVFDTDDARGDPP